MKKENEKNVIEDDRRRQGSKQWNAVVRRDREERDFKDRLIYGVWV